MEITRMNRDKHYIYRRSDKDNKNLDKKTKHLKKICGYKNKIEREDDEIIKKLLQNLPNLNSLINNKQINN